MSAGLTIKELVASKRSGTTAASHGDLRMDCYASATRGARPDGVITLRKFIDTIRSDEFADRVSEIREALANGDTEWAKALKKDLEAVSLSGCITKGKKAKAAEEGRFQHSGLLQIDIDGKDNPGHTVDEIREILINDPCIQAVFVSPSGEGVKGIARVPASVETHAGAYAAAVEHFGAKGLVVDPVASDVVRLCFVSHDPNAWLRESEAAILHPIAAAFDPPSRPESDAATAVKMPGKIRQWRGRSELSAESVRRMLAVIPRPPYMEWLEIASAVWNVLGETEGDAVLHSWCPEESRGEYAKKFKNRLKDFRAGTLFYYARRHGFVPTIQDRAAGMGISEQQAEQLESKISSGNILSLIGKNTRGVAEAFGEVRFGQWAYVHDECCWRFYEDGIWCKDTKREIIDDLQSTVPQLFREAIAQFERDSEPADDAQAKAVKEREKKIEALKGLALKIHGMRYAKEAEANAMVLEEFRATREEFDKNPKILVIENGTIDFDTLEIADHDPAFCATVKAGFVFLKGAQCPAFDAFMREFTCGDTALENYLWRFMAYACTGETHVDTVPFLYGSGANGKSTFLHVFQALLGGFARTLDVDSLLSDSSRHDSDYKKATLEGVRLAVADELPSGRRLNTAMLKRLVGGDTIIARQPHERVREFRPTHKLLICGNHKPAVKDLDEGTWRRLHLVPCNASFLGREKNRNELVAEFLGESAGILNRIIQGYADFCERRLEPPPCIVDASNDYRESQDQVRLFSDERLKRMPGIRTLFSTVKAAYDDWCKINGEDPIAQPRKLGEELRRLGWTTEKGTGNKTFLCDAIIPDEA